ncbi:MAG: DUF1573 domain-containing protein [Prevotellaceae bacterium]|nr:DUF1573 domain-containing protein [Prevotellaceae bacterium]
MEIEYYVNEWTGKTVYFPDIEPEFVYKNTTNIDTCLSEYKILNYTDSTGCTSCKLRMDTWISYIKELDSSACFLFYFHPKNREDLLLLLKKAHFINYPVYMDTSDELNKLNKFPSNTMFQCFLLDRDNKVLAVGNPVLNPKIWELYKEIITGKTSDKPPITTIEIEQQEIKLTDLQTGKTSEAVFKIKNTGIQPLIIYRVESFCGCTVPEWDRQPVISGKSAEIRVKITPEKNEYFNKTVTVHCNIETGQILLKINGTVKN